MPSSVFSFTRQFKEDLAKGVHNFTSDLTCTLRFALVAAANAPLVGNSVLLDLTQIAYTNLVGTREITGVTAEQVGGTAPLTAASFDIEAAAGGAVAAFRYVWIYNDDPTAPADPLIGYWDYQSDIALAAGQKVAVTIGTNGLGTIA